jgi:hypothetical protein
MRRVLHLIVFGVAVILPATAQADGVELRAGAMFPSTGTATASDCQSGCNLFADLETLFGASKSGWVGATGGVEFSRRIVPGVELGVHIDGYDTRRHTHYASSQAPPDLRQTLDLSYVPIGVSVRLMPRRTRMGITPYVAAGPDIVVWQYKEHGGYYDFQNQAPFDDAYEASGVTPGLHVAAGVRVPLSYDVAFTTEVRYLWTSKVGMGGDFAAYDIQPGGVSATFGLRLHF